MLVLVTLSVSSTTPTQPPPHTHTALPFPHKAIFSAFWVRIGYYCPFFLPLISFSAYFPGLMGDPCTNTAWDTSIRGLPACFSVSSVPGTGLVTSRRCPPPPLLLPGRCFSPCPPIQSPKKGHLFLWECSSLLLRISSQRKALINQLSASVTFSPNI